MRFSDFLVFDEAAQAVYSAPTSQCRFRAYLSRLWEATRDFRKGVAFKEKPLDDIEHAVFAQRLADKLRARPSGYGDFLHQSIMRQGEVMADMKWAEWEVTKKAMELGGVDPDDLTTPAERLAAVNRINWAKVTLPKLKAKLGPAFKVEDDWKRQFGIERLKKIKGAYEQGKPLAPQDKKLLGIWKTLEIQFADQILPLGNQGDVGQTRLPMSPQDRKRLYKVLTGATNEGVEHALQLSPQSAYDYLTKYGIEIISDEEVKDLYLTRILNDLKNKEAFIPSSPRGSEADKKRWRDSAARSWGGFLSASRYYDPHNTPGFVQWLTGMTTRRFKTRTNPSGRQVPYAYPEPEEFKADFDMPGIKYTIDVPSQEVPDERINAFYRSGTPEANAAVEEELVKPAKQTLNWLRHTGWEVSPSRLDDYTQQVVMGMLNRTGAVRNWRTNAPFRRSTALMLARRYISQGWPSETREKSGRIDTLDRATGGDHERRDDFSRIQGSVAKARQVIQRAVASLLDTDTSPMKNDEEKFVDALDSLRNPDRATIALDVLDQLATRYRRELPQVKLAVNRIQRHLKPLMRRAG